MSEIKVNVSTSNKIPQTVKAKNSIKEDLITIEYQRGFVQKIHIA